MNAFCRSRNVPQVPHLSRVLCAKGGEPRLLFLQSFPLCTRLFPHLMHEGLCGSDWLDERIQQGAGGAKTPSADAHRELLKAHSGASPHRWSRRPTRLPREKLPSRWRHRAGNSCSRRRRIWVREELAWRNCRRRKRECQASRIDESSCHPSAQHPRRTVHEQWSLSESFEKHLPSARSFRRV